MQPEAWIITAYAIVIIMVLVVIFTISHVAIGILQGKDLSQSIVIGGGRNSQIVLIVSALICAIIGGLSLWLGNMLALGSFQGAGIVLLVLAFITQALILNNWKYELRNHQQQEVQQFQALHNGQTPTDIWMRHHPTIVAYCAPLIFLWFFSPINSGVLFPSTYGAIIFRIALIGTIIYWSFLTIVLIISALVGLYLSRHQPQPANQPSTSL